MAHNQQSPYQAPNRPGNGRLQRLHGNAQQNGAYQGQGQDIYGYRSPAQPQVGDAYSHSDMRYVQGSDEMRKLQAQQGYFGDSGNRGDSDTPLDNYARQRPYGSPSLSNYRPPPIDKLGYSEALPQSSDHQSDRGTYFKQLDKSPRSAPAHQASFVIPIRENDNRNRYPGTLAHRPAPPQRLRSSQSEHTSHHDRTIQPSEIYHSNQQATFNFDVDNGSRSRYEEGPRSKSAGGNYPSKSSRSKTAMPIKPTKERILIEAPSPETMSWDNPFPTFPMKGKKKIAQADSQSLNGSVTTSHPRIDTYSDNIHGNRPQTAKSSKSVSSPSKDRETDAGSIPENFSVQRRLPAQVPSVSKGNYSAYDKPQPMLPQQAQASSRHPQEAALFQQNARNARSSEQRVRTPERSGRSFDIERKYGNPGVVPTMPLNTTHVQDPPRSMTMPSNVSENRAKKAIQSNYLDGSNWQETRPIPPSHGAPSIGYVPKISTANTSDYEILASEHMCSNEIDAASRSVDRPKRAIGPNESFGDFFDPYYEGGSDDALMHAGTDHSRNWRTPTEEEMPNFDAVPDNRPPYRRGMTVDQHLHISPRKEAPNLPELPVPYQRQDSDRSFGNPRSPGQLKQSKSSPSIRDQSSPVPRQRNGFASPPLVPGHVPWMPPTPSSRGQLSPKYSVEDSNSYFGNNFDKSNAVIEEYSPAPPERIPSGGGRVNGQRLIGQQITGSSPYAGNPPQNHQQFDYGRPRPPPHRQHNQTPLPRKHDQMPLRAFQQTPQNQWQQSRPPHQEHVENRQFQQRQTSPMETNISQVNPRRPSGNRPTPVSPETPITPQNKASNPDALPHHPSPVRSGLMQGTPPPPKPVPVRQYNATSAPVQATTSSQPAPPVSSAAKRTSTPVTHEELGRLRQVIKANPSDRKTQLVYAKKMVEAASVLADEGGRADPKTRNKNRERYIFDAHKIVKKLVSNGYPEAMFYLADCHSRGLLGLQEDSKDAFSLYQSAAKAGHAQAAYRVAVCCEIGQEEGGGTRRDPLKAIQWYKRAAALGDVPAMYKMGMIQLKGLLGQPKNPKDAITWLKRAAERADEENPHALHELALLYESASASDTIIRDPTYSIQLFLQAANLGYKFSQYRLGTAYEYGHLDCPISPRDSIAWYSKAAVQGEHQSELALSGWYLTGSEGTLQQSDTEAYLWARKAAQAGLAKAEFAMGYFTETGIGAPPNVEDAKRWYWRAASQNFPKARERLEDLNKGGAKMQKTRVSRSAMNRQSDSECLVM